MQEKTILCKNQDVVTRLIDNETILMPIYNTTEDIKCIYTLDDVGTKIWRLIDGERTVMQIKRMLLEKFEVTHEKLDKDLSKFLKELEEIKVVTRKK